MFDLRGRAGHGSVVTVMELDRIFPLSHPELISLHRSRRDRGQRCTALLRQTVWHQR